MNIKYKAITFAILFTPFTAIASEDFQPGDWLHDIYSGVHMTKGTMNNDVAIDDINKTIEAMPTAAGFGDEGYVFPINLD